ncbi:MAG TPA: S8 family serine peptidase [bacterium]
MTQLRLLKVLMIVVLVATLSPLFGDMIRLKTYPFDTKQGEPILPPQLMTTEKEVNYYVIQCAGPVEKAWKDDLKASGVYVLGYIPDYAYLVRMDKLTGELVSLKPYITYVGLWQPAYKIQPALWNMGGTFRAIMLIHDTEDLAATIAKVRSTGANVTDASEMVSKLVVAEVNSSQLTALAQIEGIWWIEFYTDPVLYNNNSSKWCQSGATGDTTIWNRGIRGSNQILGTTDSGITTAHWAFYDAAYPITTWGSYPSHRKIRNYSRGGSSAGFGDESGNSWHGTHTCGTVSGDDSYNGGTSTYDGISKSDKHSFVDIGVTGGGLSVWADLNQLWDTSYAYGATVVSNSWGWGTFGDYASYDAQTDQFMWRRKNLLLVVSAGNSGSGASSTGSPGNAKGTLTIGSVGRLDATAIAGYSSRGPTLDGRYKPTIMAPGGLNTGGDPGLYSSNGGTSGGSSGYWQMSGTSMASPSACGTVGLIREYLNRGFYPTGAEVPGNAIPNPSSALLKALAVVSADPNITGYTVPNYNIGWGRIDAESVLYFSGQARKLLLHDSASGGLNTNDSVVYSWDVTSAIPVRVTLCWTDSAGNPSATRPQTNDLDLRVVNPGGTSYWGNYYSGGQSATGGSRDSNNVEENFRLNSPTVGRWSAWVRGRNVPTGANQTFAITISGDVTNLGIGVAEETGLTATLTGIRNFPTVANHEISYTLQVARAGNVVTRMFNVLGARVYQETRNYAKGEYQALIPVASLPHGVYFLVIDLPGQTYEQKVVLVK